LERRTGGNLSFNDAIDYGELLKRLKDAAIVRELYREAGLDLEADLAVLRQAPRLTADKKALTWATPQIWKGDLKVPVLTLSNIGDNISPVAAQQAFQSTVDRAGRGDLLRQVYVNSAGHCGFSPAEAMTAVDTLVARLESNEWGGTTNPFTMNAKAQSLNAGAARFIAYQPEAFQRAFDTCDLKVVMRQKSVTVKSKNNDCRK
jgi:hypothetical protein